jgi:hypothetical protein
VCLAAPGCYGYVSSSLQPDPAEAARPGIGMSGAHG